MVRFQENLALSYSSCRNFCLESPSGICARARGTTISQQPLAKLAIPEPPVEQLQHHLIDDAGCAGIVPGTLIPHESMGAIKLVPAEVSICIGQSIVNDRSAFTRYVRILSSENHQELTLNLSDPVKRIVVQPFAQASLVDVCRITTGCRQHVRIHCCPKR